MRSDPRDMQSIIEREARLAHSRITKLNPLYPEYEHASIARMAQRNKQLKDVLSKTDWYVPQSSVNVPTDLQRYHNVKHIRKSNALKAAVIKRRKGDLLANAVKGFLKRRHPTGFPGTLPDSVMDSLVPYIKNDKNAMSALRRVSKHEKETVDMHSLPPYRNLHRKASWTRWCQMSSMQFKICNILIWVNPLTVLKKTSLTNLRAV